MNTKEQKALVNGLEKHRKMFLPDVVWVPTFVLVSEKIEALIKESLYILIILMSISGGLTAQDSLTVWPGDVNNNGIVNGVDVLYWSVAQDVTGPKRSKEDSLWSPQRAAVWEQTFPDGTLNYAYADCDGNGRVNEADLNVIRRNFSRTRPDSVPDVFISGFEGIDPPLSLRPKEETAAAGDTVFAEVFLGDATIPASGFFGITFTIPYDPEVAGRREQPAMFELEKDSWIGRENAEVKVFELDDSDLGRTHIAVYRKKKENVPPDEGQIGTYSIVVVEDIALGINSVELGLEDVKMVSLDLTERPLALDSLVVPLRGESTGRKEAFDDPRLKIFPNPVQNRLEIRWSGAGTLIEYIEITNLLGQPLKAAAGSNARQYAVDLSDLPAGLYVVRVHTREGIIARTITKN